MTSDRDRDDAVDRMLRSSLGENTPAALERRSLGGGGPTAQCLDAGMLAAWADGALSADEVAAVEAHAAGCARCQAMAAAMARTAPAPATPGRSRYRRLVPALVPLAAAAAFAFWIALPSREPMPPVMEEGTSARSESRDVVLPPATTPVPEPPASREQRQRRTEKTPAEKDELAQRQPTLRDMFSQAAPAAPAAAPPAAANEGAAARAPASEILSSRAARDLEIVSSDPQRRWRLAGGRIERSTDQGATWIAQDVGTTAALTAAASPAPDVCWVVGRAGTVLVTTDGTTWRRVAFPEAVDLIGVVATNAATAVVVTADGRSFSTKDAGRTWNRGGGE